MYVFIYLHLHLVILQMPNPNFYPKRLTIGGYMIKRTILNRQTVTGSARNNKYHALFK